MEIPEWLWQNVISGFFTEGLVVGLWLAWTYRAAWYYPARYLLTKPFKPPPIIRATLTVEVAGLIEKNPYSGEYESIYFD